MNSIDRRSFAAKDQGSLFLEKLHSASLGANNLSVTLPAYARGRARQGEGLWFMV
jgi:hypothetical protein